MKSILVTAVLALFATSAAAQERIIVRVPPRDIGNRQRDNAPAEFQLTSKDLPANRRLDPATLEVVAWDAGSRQPVGKPLSFRWYDDAIPYDFPECEQNIFATDGVNLKFTNKPRWGDYYNLLGDGAGGRLVWDHTQVGNKASTYAITFRLLPEGQRPTHLAPRGFVGDGACRCAPRGASSTNISHSRVAAADWGGDGLIDLLVGAARGHILLYRNIGTKTEPKFSPPRLVMTADGRPLDAGWTCAPCVIDWDGDGVTDLLCGSERNRVVWFRNTATNADPKLVLKGFVTAGGKPIELPVEPVPKSPKGVYELDYYPVLEAVDWNDDGKLDLLAGGFITGRIFLYASVGKNADGTPQLEARGPIEADGQPLNVGDWAAAPTTGDFQGDGKRHLISGSMPLTAVGGDGLDAATFLRYFENVGSRKEPKLVQRPFPKRGDFAYGSMASPRAVDLNGDGLLDLVVSANENLFLFLNVGTKTKPLWEVHNNPLPSEWGRSPLPTWGVQFIDWDGDGKLDMLSMLMMYLNKGDGRFEGVSLLQSGNKIEHLGTGDGWIFTQLADVDGDGRLDLLYGTHSGNVFLHRNLGGTPPKFDENGELLRMDNDKPIHVGPVPGQKMDFDVLQGARTTLAVADFDGNGRLDLVVGDTYGKVRAYLNTGDKSHPKFAAPIELGNMSIRMIPYAADWDSDGQPDIIGSSADGKIWWWRNLGDGKFDQHQTLKIPEVFYSPFATVVDWNSDGTPDLFVSTAYGYSCWFARSFLEHGYVAAQRVSSR
jgi:hypothetical protein